MNIMLVGGSSPMTKELLLKLHKEGHRVFVLSGDRGSAHRYEYVFERYDFPYDSASVEEVFRSVNPDVTILLGAFDGNLTGEDPKQEASRYAAGLQNILLSWSALKKGRLIFLSSGEVYGDYYPAPLTEAIQPIPRGIRQLMLFQAEQSCRFYQEQLHQDVVILRLDTLCQIPKNRAEASSGVLQRMCLNAFEKGTVPFRENFRYGLTDMGDAAECIYRVAACKKPRHGLYHISSGQEVTELQIASALQQEMGGSLELIDNPRDAQHSSILSGQRFREEFDFVPRCQPEDVIRKILQYMKRHSGRFLDGDHPGRKLWHRLYYQSAALFGALFPYLENLLLFIPFFMLNNRATGSRYFSRIDFYLLYVMLFAVTYGQRQATFSAVLATLGYLFRQMYDQAGLAVAADYNTYVWIAEIFILGLVVGYLRDQLRFMKEEKQQEFDFLSERVTDIEDINDSNLRVKEGLITQVVNYDFSLGTVYNLVEKLEADHPAKILFQAIALIRDLMACPDVSLYRINGDQYARLVGHTSKKASSMGHTVYIPDKTPLAAAFSRREVYLNQTLNPEYPMMACCLFDGNQMSMMVLLWSVPMEKMTIDEANRLTVVSRLTQQAVNRSEEYLDLLQNERYQKDSRILRAAAFEELLDTYHNAGKNNLTEYHLLRVISADVDQKTVSTILSDSLRPTDYPGCRFDGSLYILLTSTDRSGCRFVQNKLEGLGIHTEISEEVDA